MIFSIYSDGPVDKKDWESRQSKLGDNAISTITDDLEAGNPSKVATSIPNPFARMYLFDTAFQMVKLGHKQVGYTLYNTLVSDCLDVFQLLYNIGDGSNLKFIKWNKQNELQVLKSKPDLIEGSRQRIHPHRLLAQSLEMALKSERFIGFEDLYFIFYKDILLGGTSPLTIFYTSPNFQRIMEENPLPSMRELKISRLLCINSVWLTETNYTRTALTWLTIFTRVVRISASIL
jgi:hypothetical protein